MKILDVEIKEDVFNSDYWQMTVNGNNPDYQKEFKKVYYIEDKKQQLKRIRELESTKSRHYESPIIISNIEFDIFENGILGFTEYQKSNQERMFYGVYDKAYKRQIELEVYLLEIIENSNKLKNDFDKICYFIDEQFKIHKNVFDEPKKDMIFRIQYNCIIFEQLQKEINTISKKPIIDLSTQIQQSQNKSLEWNAQKTTIGTLFGLLYNIGAIKGTKTDLSKGLNALFPNLSINTLNDNISLKINDTENKYLYDIEAEKILKPFIEYIKSTRKQK